MRLKKAGVDGMTIYQEVYDRTRYIRKVHRFGKKTDYRNTGWMHPSGPPRPVFEVSMSAPCLDWGKRDGKRFYRGFMPNTLEDKYLDTEIGLSLPRINPAEGGFQPYDAGG